MNITKTQSDALNYQVNIEIAAADYADALKKRLNEYRRRADIKGFRKGMAPMSLIQRLYGDQSLYEAVNRLVSDQLDAFIRDEKIRVVGEPLPSEDQPQLDWKVGNDFTRLEGGQRLHLQVRHRPDAGTHLRGGRGRQDPLL